MITILAKNTPIYGGITATPNEAQAIGPNKIVITAKKVPMIILPATFCIGQAINHPSRQLANTCIHPYHFF
jgi:hypothetical protein